MAGTISLSLSQQFDELGEPMAGGKLNFYRAGTTSTPQNAFFDADLTLPFPNPYTLNAAGRIPQFFLADGSIKVVLIDRHGNTQIDADNVLVIGPSSGGGGGGSVDPTTVLQTGWLQPIYGAGVVSGFVRANGRTIGSATSGASERANADTQALFLFLYAQDVNLAVSTGRVNAAADWAANKTIALPDMRGVTIAGLDDMGNSAAGRLTSTYFGTSPTTLGARAGTESKTLLQGNLPAATLATTVVDPGHDHTNTITQAQFALGSSSGVTLYGTSLGGGAPSTLVSSHSTGITASTALGGSSTPVSAVQPTMLVTLYLKL